MTCTYCHRRAALLGSSWRAVLARVVAHDYDSTDDERTDGMSESNSGKWTLSIGTPWLIGWLATIGMAHLGFGQGALALLIWPYYLGDVIAKAVGQ